jgi:ferrous iron transport protein A
MRTLAEISVGESVTIVDITGDDSLSARLMEMGLTDGEQIKMIGRAPFGDPIEIQVRGYRLSLRTVEARRVVVQSTSAPSQ